MHGVCAPKGISTALAHTDVLNFACILQLYHGFYRLLDRRYFVESMDIVQIDIQKAEAFEGLLNGSFAVCRTRVDIDFGFRAGSIHLNGELCGEEDVFALLWVGGKPFANQVF